MPDINRLLPKNFTTLVEHLRHDLREHILQRAYGDEVVGVGGSRMGFNASLERLAFYLLTQQRYSKKKDIIGPLLAGDPSHLLITQNMYRLILQRQRAVIEIEPLSTGGIKLPTPFGNVLISPNVKGHGIDDVLGVLLTTPVRAGDVPLMPVFTQEVGINGKRHSIKNNLLQLGALAFYVSELGCKVYLGQTPLGKLSLPDVYESDLSAIKDEATYMRAWDVFIVDYLRRAIHTVNQLRQLFTMERQAHKASTASAEANPRVADPTIYARALSPLFDITEAAGRGFSRLSRDKGSYADPSSIRTLGRAFVTAQVDKLNNAMICPGAVIYPSPGYPVTHSLIQSSIDVLQSLLDPKSHLKRTYQYNKDVLKGVEIDILASDEEPFTTGHPIAVRRMIDQIVYEAIRCHDPHPQGPQKLTFTFNNPRGEIFVSYSRPQSLYLRYVLDQVATRFDLTTSYQQNEAGIDGVCIRERVHEGGASGGSFGKGHIPSTPHSNPFSSARAFSQVAQPPLTSSAMLSSAFLVMAQPVC